MLLNYLYSCIAYVRTYMCTCVHIHAYLQFIGLGLLALGIYLLASGNGLQFITGNQYINGGALILIAGLITVFISVVGLIGAAGMWPCLIVFVSHNVLLYTCSLVYNTDE